MEDSGTSARGGRKVLGGGKDAGDCRCKMKDVRFWEFEMGMMILCVGGRRKIPRGRSRKD